MKKHITKGQMEHYIKSLSDALIALENYMIKYNNYNLNDLRIGLNILKMEIELDSRMYLDNEEE